MGHYLNAKFELTIVNVRMPDQPDIEGMLKSEVERLLGRRRLAYNSLKVLRDDSLDAALSISWDREKNLTLTYSEYLRFIDLEEIRKALKEEIKHYQICLDRKSAVGAQS